MNATQANPAPMMARFAQVLAEIETVVKNAEADAGKYVIRYADINTILATVKPAVAKHGMSIAQPIGHDDQGNMRIDIMLVDLETGEALTFPGPLFAPKGDPQAIGSTITYYRRYSLTSLFALQVGDDDGAQGHRAATDPENRTAAETEARRLIKAIEPPEDRHELVKDFKAHFGMSLLDLPESRHGDALGFVKWWIDGGDQPTATEYTSADQAADTGEGY